MRKGTIGGVFLGVIMVVGLIILAMCAERVPTGHVGVVYNMNGGVDGEILTQGWHIVSPTKKVTTLYQVMTARCTMRSTRELA